MIFVKKLHSSQSSARTRKTELIPPLTLIFGKVKWRSVGIRYFEINFKRTYRLLPFWRQPDMKLARLRQTFRLTSISGIPSTWVVHRSQTPQLPDCRSWSSSRQGRSGYPGRSRSCSRRCRHFVLLLEEVSTPPWSRWTTRRRLWPGLAGLPVLRVVVVHFSFSFFCERESERNNY